MSEPNLRAVLGDANVKRATGLAIEAVPGPSERSHAGDQVGGVPANIGPELWPICELCKTRMTFVAQLTVGPDNELHFPEPGALAIFVCGAEPPEIDELCQTYDGSGTAVFVVSMTPATSSLFTAADLAAIATMQREMLAWQQVRAAKRGDRTTAPATFLLEPINGFRSQPVLSNAYRTERRPIISCTAPESRGPDYANQRAHVGATIASSDHGAAIEIAAFPDWVQAPIDDLICACGARMELVVQLADFDAAINFGTGRGYVFACAERCGPRSFALQWQC